jgi:Lar family restriction alleviation protein
MTSWWNPGPCPFCGSTTHVGGWRSPQEEEPEWHRIECEACGATGPKSITARGALNEWNKRAGGTP